MGLKKYIICSFLFMLIIYAYAFSLELGIYRASFIDLSISLPVAAWIILPVVLLFIATILHMFFYSVVNSFKEKSLEKDEQTMLSLFKTSLLGKTFNKKFKTKAFRNTSKIFSQFDIFVKDNTFSSTDDELNNIVAKIQDVKNGKYIEDKNINFKEKAYLNDLNLKNKILENSEFCLEILKKPEDYNEVIVEQAFEQVLKEKDIEIVKRVYGSIKLTKDFVFRIFEKDAENEDFSFTNEEALKLTNEVGFDENDFVKLARIYESIIKPDQIIGLFSKLSAEKDEATKAYLHVLCEYEMIDKVKEILATVKDTEYTAFRALIDLKQVGKNYNLEALSYK